jgi:hypothetical protein
VELGRYVGAPPSCALSRHPRARRTRGEPQRRAVAILQIGWMDDDVQQEAARVDQDVPFAARDLLARLLMCFLCLLTEALDQGQYLAGEYRSI